MLFRSEDEIDAAMTGGSSFVGGKGRIYAFFMDNHTDKEKVRFLKDEYGIGGPSHALSGATHSGEDHDGTGLHYKKQDCPDVHLNWEKVSKRITSLVQKGRYLTEQEQAQYDKIQADKDLAEEDAIQAQQPEIEEETQMCIRDRCVSVREPYSAERRKAASERAKAAGYQPPVKKSGS